MDKASKRSKAKEVPPPIKESNIIYSATIILSPEFEIISSYGSFGQLYGEIIKESENNLTSFKNKDEGYTISCESYVSFEEAYSKVIECIEDLKQGKLQL